MMAQEFSERREDYQGEKRRMEDKVYALIIELVDRVSSMEATQKELIESVRKANNHNQRIASLEEYRARQIQSCAEIQMEKKSRKFPWVGVSATLVGAIFMRLLDKFIFN